MVPTAAALANHGRMLAWFRGGARRSDHSLGTELERLWSLPGLRSTLDGWPRIKNTNTRHLPLPPGRLCFTSTETRS